MYYVLKMSSKAGMVHFVVVKSAGRSTLWTDFKYFKKEFENIMCSMIRLFTEQNFRANFSILCFKYCK